MEGPHRSPWETPAARTGIRHAPFARRFNRRRFIRRAAAAGALPVTAKLAAR